MKQGGKLRKLAYLFSLVSPTRFYSREAQGLAALAGAGV